VSSGDLSLLVHDSSSADDPFPDLAGSAAGRRLTHAQRAPAVGAADGPRLDLRTLDYQNPHNPRSNAASGDGDPDADIPFEPLEETPWYPQQFRAKVVNFKDGGAEVVLRLIDREKAKELYEKTHGYGFPVKPRVHVPDDQLTDEERAEKAENQLRANRRAKTKVRQLVKQMGANHLLTLTTRQQSNTREEMTAVWAKFVRLVRTATRADVPYLAVLEPHPTNPSHLHIHAAITSRLNVDVLRRCWFIALGGRGGERGRDTPGNVDIRKIKVPRGHRRSERIAKYISKYITKDLVPAFNKKRYFHSKIDPLEIRRFWIDAQTSNEALQFALSMTGGHEFRIRTDLYMPESDDFLWFQFVPAPPGDRRPSPGDPPF
jgi:hypothetical protein